MRTFAAVAFVVVSSAAFAGDRMSTTINPYAHLNDTRAELAVAYPELTDAELDKLVFRIADVQSVKALNLIEEVGARK